LESYNGGFVISMGARLCLFNYTSEDGPLNNGSSVTVSGNQISDALGAVIDITYFDSLMVSNNVVKGCGALWPGNLYCILVSPCEYTPGREVISGNSVEGNQVSCSVPLYPSAYYFDPVPLTSKSVSIRGNTATDDLCVGMRLDNVQTFQCKTSAPHVYLQPFYFPFGNIVHGYRFDIVRSF
jgi:hypothetical protein